MNKRRTSAIALALLAIFASDASARNAAGSAGAAHQGAAHHAHSMDRHHGGGGFIGNATPPLGHAKPLPQLPKHQGVHPDLESGMRSDSSESRYRAEMCRVLSDHASQLSCFNAR